MARKLRIVIAILSVFICFKAQLVEAAAFSAVSPKLFSPNNSATDEAIVNGEDNIVFEWEHVKWNQVDLDYCNTTINICNDIACTNIIYWTDIKPKDGSTVIAIAKNGEWLLKNDGKQYYWQISGACISPEAIIVKSAIASFKTYDKVIGATLEFGQESPVTEKSVVDLYVEEANGAVNNDYKYSYSVTKVRKADNFSETNELCPCEESNPSCGNKSYCEWTVPEYDPSYYYTLFMNVGTVSEYKARNGIFGGVSASRDFEVKKAIAITPSSIPPGTIGYPYGQQLLVSGVDDGEWYSEGLPGGLTLDSKTGLISGIPDPETSGSHNVKIYVISRHSNAQRVINYTLVIYENLSIGVVSLPNGYTYRIYKNATLSALGGKGPFTWELGSEDGSTTGALPPGLNLSTSGVISGEPDTAGDYSFSVKLTDATSNTAYSTFTITVIEVGSITNPTHYSGVAGQEFELHLTSNLSNFTTYSHHTLPDGLLYDTDEIPYDTIKGNLPVKGKYSFPVSAYRGLSILETKIFYIDVVENEVAIDTDSIPTTTVGSTYISKIIATGGMAGCRFTYDSTTLPPGLSISPNLLDSNDKKNAILHGVPEVGGDYTFTLTASDCSNPPFTASKEFTMKIYDALDLSTVEQLPFGAVGAFYSQGLGASGGTGDYTWSLKEGSLPDGLKLINGTISGTPSESGTYAFKVKLSDEYASIVRPFSLEISAAPLASLSFGDNSLSGGTVGVQYTPKELTAYGGNNNFTWSVTQLPAGLSFNTGTHKIEGTPNVGGSFNVIVEVWDSEVPPAHASQSLSLNVVYRPLTLSGNLANGKKGVVYTQRLTADGGKAPYTWIITDGGLPNVGITTTGANGETGLISGAPNDVGVFPVTIQVSDSQNPPVTKTQSFTVQITNADTPARPTLPSSAACEATPEACTGSSTNLLTGVLSHDQKLFTTQGSAGYNIDIS